MASHVKIREHRLCTSTAGAVNATSSGSAGAETVEAAKTALLPQERLLHKAQATLLPLNLRQSMALAQSADQWGRAGEHGIAGIQGALNYLAMPMHVCCAARWPAGHTLRLQHQPEGSSSAAKLWSSPELCSVAWPFRPVLQTQGVLPC